MGGMVASMGQDPNSDGAEDGHHNAPGPMAPSVPGTLKIEFGKAISLDIPRERFPLVTTLTSEGYGYFVRNMPAIWLQAEGCPPPLDMPIYNQSLSIGNHYLRRHGFAVSHVDEDGWPVAQKPKILSLGPTTLPVNREIAPTTQHGCYSMLERPLGEACAARNFSNMGFDAIVANDFAQYYTPQELAWLIYNNGPLHAWQMQYEKVSGHLCGNEVFYVLNDENGNVRISYGKHIQSIGSNMAWLRHGSKYVSFEVGDVEVSGTLAATVSLRQGEWALYKLVFLEDVMWPQPVADSDSSTMMSDSYYGRMTALERHFVVGSPSNDIVSFPMELSNVVLWSHGSQIYCFTSGGTLWYVDKALVYSTADWIAYKPRVATTFAGIQAYARVQARSYRAKPEQTHRIVGLSAALGFVLNVDTEISALLAMVHTRKKHLDLLNNLLAFNTHKINSPWPILKILAWVVLFVVIFAIWQLNLELGEPYQYFYTAAPFGRPDINYIQYLCSFIYDKFLMFGGWYVVFGVAFVLSLLWWLLPTFRWHISTVDHLVKRSMAWMFVSQAREYVGKILGHFPPGSPPFHFHHQLPLSKVVVVPAVVSQKKGIAPKPALEIGADTHPEDVENDQPIFWYDDTSIEEDSVPPYWHLDPSDSGSSYFMIHSAVPTAPPLPARPVPLRDPHSGTKVQALWKDILVGGTRTMQLTMVRKQAREMFAVHRPPLAPLLTVEDVLKKFRDGEYDSSLVLELPKSDAHYDESESSDFLVPYGVCTDLGGPILPLVSPGTLIIAFCERMGIKRPADDDVLFQEALVDYKQALFDMYLNPTTLCTTAKVFCTEPIRPLTWAQWQSKFSTGKRKSHERALVEIREGARIRTSSVVHVKKEVLLKGRILDDVQTFKRPRIISAKHRTYDVVEAPWSAAKQLRQAEIMDETHFIIFGGVSAYHVGRRVNAKISKLRELGFNDSEHCLFIISQDTKDHDGSTKRQQRKAHFDLEEKLGRDEVGLAARRETAIYSGADHQGFKVMVDSAISSGESTTLSNNTDITGANVIAGLRRCEKAGLKIVWDMSFAVVCGDDADVFVVTLKQNFRAYEDCYTHYHAEIGFRLELTIHDGIENLARAGFCSARFIRFVDVRTGELTLYLLPMIGRCFAKLGWFVNPNPALVHQSYKGDLISRAVQFYPLQVMRRFFMALYDKAHAVNATKAILTRTAVELHMGEADFAGETDSMHLMECPETYEDLEIAYGMGFSGHIDSACHAFTSQPFGTIVSDEIIGTFMDYDEFQDDHIF